MENYEKTMRVAETKTNKGTNTTERKEPCRSELTFCQEIYY